jgi:hypothetical protein
MDKAPIFSSTSHFNGLFIDKLGAMLESPQIGAFILVLANASMEKNMLGQLYSSLKLRFDQIANQLNSLADEELDQLPVDDLNVFRSLEKIGLEQLNTTHYRESLPWQLQFNQLRSFRPARNSDKAIMELYQAFNEQAFHFNKPFLNDETLWQGDLAASQVKLMYNKFPFAGYHGILIVEPDALKPQFLSRRDCQVMDQMIDEMSGLSNLGLAYNSLGGGASVNHQHWQLFLSAKPYPIESSTWRHNAGQQPYPLLVNKFESVSQSWARINELQSINKAFNLFIRPGCVYLIERKNQGSYVSPSWTSGLAWSECAGHFILADPEGFESLENESILTTLSKLAT